MAASSRRRAPSLKPRKLPSQERAKDTVSAILAATKKLVLSRGIDGTSTNRVAALAGVSIGSLYQYFPSKHALLAALLEDHEAEMLGVIAKHLDAIEGQDLAQLTRSMIEAVLDAHRIAPGLHRVLSAELPSKEPRKVDQAMQLLVQQALQARAEDVAIRDAEVGAFLLVCVVEAACHRAVLDRPDLLAHPGFVDELTALVTRYALGSSPRSARPRR